MKKQNDVHCPDNEGIKTFGMLLAGGIGQRMGHGIPKQFLEVNGQSLILYPLKILEHNSRIDSVEVVCAEDYIDLLWGIVENARLRKVKWIVPGGATCQESTYKGLINLRGKARSEDIVLIHMASYPLASEEIMNRCIESAVQKGNGCTARPVLSTVVFTDDRRTSCKAIDRDRLMLCTVPYAFRFGECSELYDRAYTEGKGVLGNFYTNTLYCDYGKPIYFTEDSNTNLKITTPEDLKRMEAYLDILKSSGNLN